VAVQSRLGTVSGRWARISGSDLDHSFVDGTHLMIAKKAKSDADHSWKERVWLYAIAGAFGVIQAFGLAWIDQRAKNRSTIVTDKVEQIHIATNSMKDALMKATEKEALQRGKTDERARADAEKEYDEKE
jgi:predicted outer membrane lipoprotein